MKRKKTKKALSGSVLALVLCFVMLIGTTFAWFTSSDSTAVNKIQAGKLEIELWDENGENKVGDTLSWKVPTNHVGDILWEPGCTYELEPVTIKNTGNLALKYRIVVSGINGSQKLNEALDWTIKSGEDTCSMDDEISLGVGESKAVTISATMRTSAGNEYQGLSIDSAAITVYATQDTVEYDSYGYEYDKDAELPDVDATPVASAMELTAAIANGGSAVLTNNVTTGDTTNSGTTTVGIKMEAGSTLDGNGNTLSKGDGNGYAILTAGSTIKNVTLNDSARAIFIANATQDTVLDNVVINGAGYAINTGSGNNGSTKLTVANSTLNGWSSWANLSSANFTNCSFGTSTYYSQEVYQHYLRPYVASTFTNCDFEAGFYIDLTKLGEGCNVTLDNCTCNGVKLTNENFADYIKIIKGVENGSNVYAANNDTLSNVIFQ